MLHGLLVYKGVTQPVLMGKEKVGNIKKAPAKTGAFVKCFLFL